MIKGVWITASEYNYDVAGRSFYLSPDERVGGRFSKFFMMQLPAATAPLFGPGQARIERTD